MLGGALRLEGGGQGALARRGGVGAEQLTDSVGVRAWDAQHTHQCRRKLMHALTAAVDREPKVIQNQRKK